MDDYLASVEQLQGADGQNADRQLLLQNLLDYSDAILA